MISAPPLYFVYDVEYSILLLVISTTKIDETNSFE